MLLEPQTKQKLKFSSQTFKNHGIKIGCLYTRPLCNTQELLTFTY